MKNFIVKNCPALTSYKFTDTVHKNCCAVKFGYCATMEHCVIKQSAKAFKVMGVPNFLTIEEVDDAQ